jgi:Ca2+-transporting ATPase
MHAPIAGLDFWPLISGAPMLLYPIHIVFLELIIDPACSIVFEAEPEEKNIMSRPPRSPAEPLFRRRVIFISFIQGIVALGLIIGVRELAASWGLDDALTRTLTFSALIFSNLCLILANRSWTKGLHHTWHQVQPALWWVFGGALGFLGLCLYLPALATLFHFAYLPPQYLLLAAATGIINLILFELFKFFCRWRKIELLS